MKRQTAILAALVISALLVMSLGVLAQTVELTYMNFTMHEIPFEQDLIDEFMQEHPNIKVTVVTKPVDSFDRQLILSSRAGQSPDVFQARPGYITSLGEMGLLADLTPFLSQDPDFAATFTNAGMEMGNLDGKQFGLPWRGGAWAVYVNRDVFEERGVSLPSEWTWGEFVELAKALTNKEKGVYGFAFAADPTDLGTAQSWAAHLAALGGRLFDDGEIAIDSKEAILALQQYRDMVEKYDVVPPNSGALRYQDVVELFGQGKVAMFVNGPWFVGTVKTAYPEVNLEIVPLPMDGRKGSVVSGTLLSMSPTTKYPEEAWTFMQFLTRRENLLRWGEAGGFVPPLVDTSGANYLNEKPLDVFVAMEQLPLTIQVGNLPNANELLRSLGSGIQAVVIGMATPEEALAAVRAEWEAIIAQE